MQICVSSSGLLPAVCLSLTPGSTTTDLIKSLDSHIPTHLLRLTHNNNVLNPNEALPSDDDLLFINLSLKAGLKGGKGGFGSQLKAKGAAMGKYGFFIGLIDSRIKTTNFDYCRDLSGRRLKTMSDATALAEYLEKEPERKKEELEKKEAKKEKGIHSLIY
jgi:hypothetical protein